MRDQVDAGRLSGVGPKPTRRVHPPAWSWIFSTTCWIVFNGVWGFPNVRRSFLATLPHPHFLTFFGGSISNITFGWPIRGVNCTELNLRNLERRPPCFPGAKVTFKECGTSEPLCPRCWKSSSFWGSPPSMIVGKRLVESRKPSKCRQAGSTADKILRVHSWPNHD